MGQRRYELAGIFVVGESAERECGHRDSDRIRGEISSEIKIQKWVFEDRAAAHRPLSDIESCWQGPACSQVGLAAALSWGRGRGGRNRSRASESDHPGQTVRDSDRDPGCHGQPDSVVTQTPGRAVTPPGAGPARELY
eukprot:768716-Hanusia_phi.AAC.10